LNVRAFCSWLLTVSVPSAVAAYCRESLVSQASGACDEAPGVPFLFWSRSCLTYHFNDQLFGRMPLLVASDVRETFADAFRAWTSVECDGKRPFYVEQSASLTTTTRAELALDRPNESVVFARTAAEWASSPDHDVRALALTLVWFDKINGEILDVDMELNTGRAAFADCAYTPCSGNMVDLLNTITHEAGHVLGLGHSAVARSTMDAKTYDNAETDKRRLGSDDSAGLCALDLPEPSCTSGSCSCPAPPIVHGRQPSRAAGCDVRGQIASGSQAFSLLGLLACCFVTTTRRRRPRAARDASSVRR
jgi:hypothetical protein